MASESILMLFPDRRLRWPFSQKICKLQRFKFMSRHPSFGKSNKAVKKRNVLKRFERVDVLKKLGRWKEDAKVTGLPKTPIIAQ